MRRLPARNRTGRQPAVVQRSAPVARRTLSGLEARPKLQGVNRSKGMLLLGLWVILSNLLPLLSLRIPNSSFLLTVLGVVAGVLLLVDR
jgi:hypothetical protein